MGRNTGSRLPTLKEGLPRLSEANWQRQVIAMAELLGWAVYHVSNVRGRLRSGSSVGFPDLVLVRERVVFAELKVGRNRLTDAQCRWRDQLQGALAEWYVWRPEGVDEVQRILEMRRENLAVPLTEHLYDGR